jgi:hypothetical protein
VKGAIELAASYGSAGSITDSHDHFEKFLPTI